jgi:hypothetical protein
MDMVMPYEGKFVGIILRQAPGQCRLLFLSNSRGQSLQVGAAQGPFEQLGEFLRSAAEAGNAEAG